MPEITLADLMKTGGLVAGFSTAAFFILRHYITERVKSDFAKQLEEIRQKNQTAIEVLRGTIQHDLEAFRSSLEISQSAARLLVERRIQCYEEYFKTYYALSDAEQELAAVFQTSIGRDREERRAEARLKFYAASNNFEAWWARSSAFIREDIFRVVHDLRTAVYVAADATLNSNAQTYKQQHAAAIKCEGDMETLIRADLAAIQKTGT